MAVSAAREEPSTRLERTALACLVLWSVCNGFGAPFGLWPSAAAAGLGCGLLVVLRHPEWARERLRPSGRLWREGAVATVLLVAATYVLYPPAAALIAGLVRQVARLYGMLAQAPALVAALLVPVVVLAEDLVWRGAVQEALTRRWGPAAGVLGATLAYGFVQAPLGSPLLVIVSLAHGLYGGLWRLRSGSLFPVLLSHLVWDLVVFALLPLQHPGDR